MVDYRKLAKAAAQAVDNKKANDVVILDIRKESDVADYLVIAGAHSTHAIARFLDESVEDALLDLGASALHRERRLRAGVGGSSIMGGLSFIFFCRKPGSFIAWKVFGKKQNR